MITQTEIDRINELARKQKTTGLTELELAEQKKLRRKYIDAIKGNLRTQLDSIEIVEEDGTRTSPKKRQPKRIH